MVTVLFSCYMDGVTWNCCRFGRLCVHLTNMHQFYSATLFKATYVGCLSCCLTSTEARWPIRDGDRVGRGRESDRLDRGNRPKKTGETGDRRQNNGSVKPVSPRHCPATCALRNCSFNCCAGQSHYDNVRCTAVDEQLGQLEAKRCPTCSAQLHLPTT